MQLSDRLAGLLAAGLGLAVVLYAQTFPPMPGQSVGPGLFPSVIGSGFLLFGVWLVVADRAQPRGPWVSFDAWVSRPRMRANALLVVGALLAYLVLVEPVGFYPMSVLLVGALMLAFGADRRWVLPVALGVTVVIHYSFYSLLRVPLPWGVLQGLAW